MPRRVHKLPALAVPGRLLAVLGCSLLLLSVATAAQAAADSEPQASDISVAGAPKFQSTAGKADKAKDAKPTSAKPKDAAPKADKKVKTTTKTTAKPKDKKAEPKTAGKAVTAKSAAPAKARSDKAVASKPSAGKSTADKAAASTPPVAASAAATATAAPKAGSSVDDLEPCYGISKAGEDDGSSEQPQPGVSAVDYQGNAFKNVPKGTCERTATPFGFGSLEPIDDRPPSAR
jgi:uncharacterized membrane protein